MGEDVNHPTAEQREAAKDYGKGLGPTLKYEKALDPVDRLAGDIRRRFTYHAPKADQPQRYVVLRDAAHDLARLIVTETPPSREQALALTKLEEAIFWANASIARNE